MKDSDGGKRQPTTVSNQHRRRGRGLLFGIHDRVMLRDTFVRKLAATEVTS